MLPDRREFDCRVCDISGGGMSIVAPEAGEIGDNIIAYIAEIGRVEGKVARIFEDGFALELNLTAFKREKMMRSINWLEKRNEFGLTTQRRHTRVVPEKKGSEFRLPDGRSYPCEVIDMSISGASIKVGVIPSIGTTVFLGKMRGTVSRHHSDGVAIEFNDVPDMGTLSDHFGKRSAAELTSTAA